MLYRASNGGNLNKGHFFKFSGKDLANAYDSIGIMVQAESSSPKPLEPEASAISENGLTVSPDPFNPSTVIRFANPLCNAIVSIFDINGKRVCRKEAITGSEITWNASGLSSGLYYIEAVIGNKTLRTRVSFVR